jgi:hypothetical protein
VVAEPTLCDLSIYFSNLPPVFIFLLFSTHEIVTTGGHKSDSVTWDSAIKYDVLTGEANFTNVCQCRALLRQEAKLPDKVKLVKF